MEIISKINKLKAVVRKARCAGQTIGFVPTMGALHEGHLSLVRKARQTSDIVIVSIFVNPTQFGPTEDLEKYPRNLSHDVELLTRVNADYVFAPSPEEIYPREFETYVEVPGLSGKMCGITRPTHFRGVTTVVAKLFAIVHPTYAFFGQKDAQQALILNKMVRDLNFPVDLRICLIIRESDGLAMSSRNAYLSAEERQAAPVLHRSLMKAASLILEGERKADRIRQTIADMLGKEPRARLDYISIVDTASLDEVEELHGESLIALAVYIGTTRLIDNILVSTP